MKNISEQTLEALAAIVKNLEAIEQLPGGTRQALVESPEATMAELKVRSGELSPSEKKERAFLQSYQKVIKIRELLRGWGDYGSKDGVSHFGYLLWFVCKLTRNYAQRLAGGGANSFLKRKQELVDLVVSLQLQVVAFQTREGIDLGVLNSLGLLKDVLVEGTSNVKILTALAQLESFMHGVEWHNDLVLGVDRISER